MRTVVVDKDIQKRYSVIHFFLHGEPNVGFWNLYSEKIIRRHSQSETNKTCHRRVDDKTEFQRHQNFLTVTFHGVP